MTFREWLLTYKRDNRIGDLASDVRRDPPAGDWGPGELAAHMLDRRACFEAFDALKAANQAFARRIAKTASTVVPSEL